jgi:outer membrane lipoprotein carrier protein
MLRPDKFLWHQDPPFEEIIIADGELVWKYDVELEQASCSPFDELADTPAIILGGEKRIEEDFDVRELESGNDTRLIELTPIGGRSSDFKAATISLRDGVPVAIEILDGFEQVTRVEFSGTEVNPELSAEAFSFSAPDDVHIVCDLD